MYKRKKTDPFTKESASDDEGDINRVAAHKHSVKPFK